MGHKDLPGFKEISGWFPKFWAAWAVLLLANVFLNTPPMWFLITVLIPFLAIEIPAAVTKDPEGENHDLARTLSEIAQRFVYQAKKARTIPLSWAAVGVFGLGGLLSWKSAWAVYHTSPFGQTGDLVSSILVGVTIALWVIPHWWDAEEFG